MAQCKTVLFLGVTVGCHIKPSWSLSPKCEGGNCSSYVSQKLGGAGGAAAWLYARRGVGVAYGAAVAGADGSSNGVWTCRARFLDTGGLVVTQYSA